MRPDPESLTPERAPASAPAATFSHGINGRFLSQATTGVQRYASEIVRCLDRELFESGERAQMWTPRDAVAPAYQAITVLPGSARGGYFWEQCELPFAKSRPILSLCNVGPIGVAEQILCIHDANVFRCPESYSFSFRNLYRLLLPLLARRAARLVTVSAASRADLAKFFRLRETEIAVLPNGHEHALDWRPELSNLREGVALDRPFVLLIGSRARHKNIRRVLDLAGALDEFGLDVVVAGAAGPIFAREGVREAPNVKFLGRVTDDDLAWLYGHALCLAFPSRFEGFGLPLLEAMTWGCPIVAAPIASSREVCGAAALYAGVDDAAAWARSIERLAREPGLRVEYSERGRARARAFSWRQSAHGYLDLARRAAA